MLLHKCDTACLYWTPETKTNVEKLVCWVFSRTFRLFTLPSPGGPWGQHLLQQRPPISPCPEATLGHTGTSGPGHPAAPPEASIAGHGVTLQQMLFGPRPAQLFLQVPSDTLEESLDGSTFRLGCSILLKLLEKKARK